MSTGDNGRIYATHGEKKILFGMKVIKDGALCLAYVKGDKAIGYITFEELCRMFYAEEPLGEINPHNQKISWPSV